MMNAGQRVFVVEDDANMRAALERLLRAVGFECKTYGSAEELLADGAAQDAACVISDQRLPAMSGLELLATMRARGGWPPMIMITAFDMPGQREEAARRGAKAYLVKPFSGAALTDAIKTAIGSAPGGRDPQEE
jgi:FixJ family two-component response regulator